jgi:hypothetical protein
MASVSWQVVFACFPVSFLMWVLAATLRCAEISEQRLLPGPQVTAARPIWLPTIAKDGTLNAAYARLSLSAGRRWQMPHQTCHPDLEFIDHWAERRVTAATIDEGELDRKE